MINYTNLVVDDKIINSIKERQEQIDQFAKQMEEVSNRFRDFHARVFSPELQESIDRASEAIKLFQLNQQTLSERFHFYAPDDLLRP